MKDKCMGANVQAKRYMIHRLVTYFEIAGTTAVATCIEPTRER